MIFLKLDSIGKITVLRPRKRSAACQGVFVQNVDGDRIVVINVPRAERAYKPVYVDGNPLCTYPRNGTMLKMFNMIDIGERAGSGIPNIFRVWREHGWVPPAITEQLEPERTLLTLTFEKIGDKKSAIKIGDKKSAINAKMKETIIAYLTDHAEAKASDIAEHIGLKPSRTRDYLNELIAEGIVVSEGGNRNRTYKLKA